MEQQLLLNGLPAPTFNFAFPRAPKVLIPELTLKDDGINV